MFRPSFKRPPHKACSPARLACRAALCAAFASPSIHAQSVLTLDGALRSAQERSWQLVAQDSAALAARQMAVAAGQLPDPMLKAGVNNLPINGPDRFSLTRDFMTMRSIGVAQEITRSDKRTARAARFEREAEVAEAGRAMALANLRRDTAIAWFDRHYQERILAVLREERAEAALQIEAAEAAYRGGRGSQADVFAARSAVALIDDRIQRSELQIATSKTRLARWVGTSADQALAPPPNITTVALDPESLVAQMTRLPQFALMAKQEAVARADADVAQSNKRSDWGVELMYNQRGPAYSNMVSINVSIPLQWDQTNRQDREVAAKLAVAEQLHAERDEAEREQMAVIRSWLQEWSSNRDRLAHYDGALLPLAAERTRASVAAYRGGAVPLTSVLEARRMEIDTRLERLRIEMDNAALWARVNYLIPTQVETTSSNEQ